MQALFRRYDGVLSTRVGYTGGDVPNATYRNHGNHAEAIEITFDPAKISYRRILEFLFQIHDPSTLDPQGNDVGRATALQSSTRATSRDGSPKKPSQMSMLQGCGQAGSANAAESSVRISWNRTSHSSVPVR